MARLSIGAAGAAYLAFSWPAVARADTAPELVPHHATYKLTLSRSVGEKGPAAASGVINYDFTGSACEGYATTFRQVTEVQPPEGESRTSDMKSATFEDGTAQQFRFNTQTTYSSAPEDDLDGAAAKQSDGTVSVAMEKPAMGKAMLKAALFPTEHLLRVLQAARDGHRVLTESVYDGSDTGKVIFDTLAVIGPPLTAGASEAPGEIEALRSVRQWPVTISYFDQGKADPQPNYVLSFDLYENGISRDLKLDYGTFTLAGELVDLKLLPVSSCKR